ncbi:boophilin-H2-like [Arapaima gigas]
MDVLFIFVVLSTTFYSALTQQQAFCDLPMDPGTGSKHSIRLYYDKVQDKCLPFQYKGEGGNENRFLTDRMCMKNCSATAEEIYPNNEMKVCHFHKSYGHCFNRYMLWYYDSISGLCKIFSYSGCGGNGNRFIDELTCNNTCSGIYDESDGTLEADSESDTPVGLIVGILLGSIGAIIIIAVTVVAVKNKKSKTTLQETKGVEVPLQDKGLETE